jgi:hypothetical protein
MHYAAGGAIGFLVGVAICVLMVLLPPVRGEDIYRLQGAVDPVLCGLTGAVPGVVAALLTRPRQRRRR